MTKIGNYVFMSIISLGAAASVAAIVSLGFSTLSLAILILCIVGAVFLGVTAENAINNHYYKKLDKELATEEPVAEEPFEFSVVKTDVLLPIVRFVSYGNRVWQILDEDQLIFTLVGCALISSKEEYEEMEGFEIGALLSSYNEPFPLPIEEITTHS